MVTDPDMPRVGLDRQWCHGPLYGRSPHRRGLRDNAHDSHARRGRRPEGHSCPRAETPAQLLAPASLEWSRSAAT